ncbi:methylenetetrahydrofolate reductase [Phyllobacterium zundukense]|uniref:Methylenetetrahydrofolate reductase n=1 Tax=Phyllobacterium zundukense TaxID=1867719 RepID=A0ACD4CUY8_9HYPH|nr:methylenetetrahydrofolate reductase [Phyllobacterium zundukense]UXN57373.1 methylenetetrahydrofolate reductase [Phyllobacterium zundukense]
MAMSHAIHLRDRSDVLDDFSVEVTTKDTAQLAALSGAIPKGTIISIPFLSTESDADRIMAAKMVRQAGYEPLPHIAARRLGSEAVLSAMLSALVNDAQVTRLLIIAGDADPSKGPFLDTATILRSGILENHGIRHVSIAGHPEGHPIQNAAMLNSALLEKRQIMEAADIEWSIFTQFAFASEPVLAWIGELRRLGIEVPIHVGIPGPASVRTLLKFAAVCGVSASTAVLKRYGLSITQLLSSAGPDALVSEYATALSNADRGDVRLHFYPFGGLRKTVDWLRGYRT